MNPITPAPAAATGSRAAGMAGRRALWLVVLVALAVAADSFTPVVFAGHSVVLGLVFYWTALRLIGAGPALLVLAAGTATLWLKWHQAFSPLLIALEGMAVGMAWRRGRNPLLADLAYWTVFGTPVSWFIYRQVHPIPHPSFEQALVVQPLNGLLAVWIAYLVLDQTPLQGSGNQAAARRGFRGMLLRRYVAFGTLPIVVATLLAVRGLEAYSVSEANNGLRESAVQFAAVFERRMAAAKWAIREFAARQQEIDWSDDQESLDRAIDGFLNRTNHFHLILAADGDGETYTSVPLRRNGRTPAEKARFIAALSTGEVQVSDVFRTPEAGGRAVIAMAAPVPAKNGRRARVIEGYMSVHILEEILGRTSVGTGGRAILVDEHLRVVAQHGSLERPTESVAGTALARGITGPTRRIHRVTGERDGEPVSFLTSHVPLPSLGWTLTLQRDWGEVLRPVERAYAWSLLITLTTVLAASAFATWSLRDFLRAWRDLIAFSRAPEVKPAMLETSARLDLPLEFNELIRNLTQMSERLAAERSAREDLLADLERRVRERTEELERAVALARSADRAKGAFLATVSHELRTPLTAIITAVRLLRMMPAARPPAEIRTLTALEDSSRALMAVISDVLDYSRLEAGAVRVEAAPFEPASLVKEVASILDPEAQRNGADLRTRPEHPENLRWRGDAKRVKQVLLNLAGNAVKFAPEGRVEIICWKTDEPERLWFAVEDDGPGIPPDRLENIFEAFVQLETNPTTGQPGTGLGLSISRRLVELMGGKIRAVDTGGCGARLEFWLPEEPPDPVPLPTGGTPSA